VVGVEQDAGEEAACHDERGAKGERRGVLLCVRIGRSAKCQTHPQEDDRDDDRERQDEASGDLVERRIDLNSAPDGKRRNTAYILQAVVVEAAR